MVITYVRADFVQGTLILVLKFHTVTILVMLPETPSRQKTVQMNHIHRGKYINGYRVNSTVNFIHIEGTITMELADSFKRTLFY